MMVDVANIAGRNVDWEPAAFVARIKSKRAVFLILLLFYGGFALSFYERRTGVPVDVGDRTGPDRLGTNSSRRSSQRDFSANRSKSQKGWWGNNNKGSTKNAYTPCKEGRNSIIASMNVFTVKIAQDMGVTLLYSVARSFRRRDQTRPTLMPRTTTKRKQGVCGRSQRPLLPLLSPSGFLCPFLVENLGCCRNPQPRSSKVLVKLKILVARV
jgi:hypothetical protein